MENVESKKRILVNYVSTFFENITKSEMDNYIREINGFKRPISHTIIRLSACPWVFVRFIQRRKEYKFGFFRRMISNFIEKIELRYYEL